MNFFHLVCLSFERTFLYYVFTHLINFNETQISENDYKKKGKTN